MVADLVRVWGYSNIGDKEQNVVNCKTGGGGGGCSYLIRYRKKEKESIKTANLHVLPTFHWMAQDNEFESSIETGRQEFDFEGFRVHVQAFEKQRSEHLIDPSQLSRVQSHREDENNRCWSTYPGM